MVLFIMIDGARPDALNAVRCPNLDALRAAGASSMQAHSVMPSVTLPCHMSIFHSVPPARHGITTNLFVPMARPLPGLVEQARAAGKRVAFVHNWEPLRDLSRPEQVVYSYYREPPLNAEYDDAVGAESVRLLRDEHDSFDFVFIYFGSVDAAGHAYGWMSAEYLGQLQRVDGLLGRVLDAAPNDATIVVQADHGGHERSHGTDMPEDMTIPWIAAGPAIRRGHTISAPIGLLDTAPILARALEVAAHPAWEGRVVEEIYL
ncbi:MAG: alkaline phosphatase family protein [Chloroflexi bacterium]|nr:alkaline phosphatase family protein [Chloroflexota bacterium]